MNEVPSHQLTVADLPDPEDRSKLAEFAHTFDGYRAGRDQVPPVASL